MSKAMDKLRAHPIVDEVENEGMDEGRWFVHLKDGWCFQESGHPGDIIHSRSVGGAVEGLRILKDARPCTCRGCAQ